MTRKALGRGLSALLREPETVTLELEQVAVGLIDPNPYQPRRAFPEATLRELADSIRSTGIVQPVLLRRMDARYQLVVGERRWRAARLAGLESVPAIVKDFSDRETLELALTENLLREDLNPLEMAHGLQALKEKFNLTHEAIAERLGLNRTTVTNTLRLLRLPEEVKQLLLEGKITAGHARALLGADNENAAIAHARLIVKHGFSVRQAEELLAEEQRRKAASAVGPPAPDKLDPNVRAAVLELERALGTRVKIQGSVESGWIQIRYYSAEDLSRIYDWIVRR